MPLIVLATIVGGFATATEASAIAVVYSRLGTLVYRELSLRDLYPAVVGAVTTTGFGTVFTPWKSATMPRDYAEAAAAVDPDFTLALHHALRLRGVASMPAPFGRHYLSTAHDETARELLLAAFAGAAQELADPKSMWFN